ncbi:MAG: glycosyltransferase [Gemmatimonadaceae bacterium]
MKTSRHPSRVCAVSFKPCWQDDSGRWMSSGGFPLQMGAIASLFDGMTLIVVRGEPLAGGLPLPPNARVIALCAPHGQDARRKVSVIARLPYYVGAIAARVLGADVVHTPLPGDIPLLALWIALALRKRVIARYSGSWVANTQSTRMNRVTKDCMRRFAGGRNVMLATGEGAEPPAPNVEWIFSTALSVAEIERDPPDLDRGLQSPPRLIYVGRLSPEKGVATLVRALATLDGQPGHPRPHLTLAGEGPERATLEALARELRCADRITFAGQLDRRSLGEALDAADLCVQPSLTEGFSKAWLDAMSRGLPVLASEVGAARSVTGADGERGWLVPPGDPAALAAALRRVLCDASGWTAIRRRCRTYVEGRTLEVWARTIGEHCARQWDWNLDDGRLRA